MISSDKAGVQFPDSEIYLLPDRPLLSLGICVQKALHCYIFVQHDYLSKYANFSDDEASMNQRYISAWTSQRNKLNTTRLSKVGLPYSAAITDHHFDIVMFDYDRTRIAVTQHLAHLTRRSTMRLNLLSNQKAPTLTT